jgi:hypothetical protein
VVAVVHEVAGARAVLVANIAGETPRLLEASTIGPGDGAGALGVCLDRHEAGRVIEVLPGSHVVCRTCTLPNAEDDQLEEALLLQAEALVPEETPEHRRAAAVLPTAPGETSRAGIIVTWPETNGHPTPQRTTAPERPVHHAPDVAAIAALLDGRRPADPLLWLDRSTGAVAIAVTHPNGAVLRSTREEAEDGTEWCRCIARTLAETALNAGHSGAFAEKLLQDHGGTIGAIGAGDAALLLPAEILEHAATEVDGLPAEAVGGDAAWWSRYGIALGVLIAATNDLAPLTTLERAPIVERPSLVMQAATRLSTPRAAVMTALACLGIMAVVPVLASGTRLALLKQRYPDLATQTVAIAETRGQLAMYTALEDEAWSMTKLLSDVVCNTPEGIDLFSIRLVQSDGSFAVTGEARSHDSLSAPEIVALMQEHLRDSRLFGEIRLNLGDGNNYGHYKFDLSGKVTAPHWRSPYEVENDFARWTLAKRQAGEGPPEETKEPEEKPTEDPADTRTVAADPEPRDPAPRDDPPDEATASADTDSDGSTASRTRARPVGPGSVGGGGGDSRSDTDSRGGRGPGPGAIPEPLTDAQITAMTIEEIRAHQILISNARKRTRRGDDPALDERLKNDFDRLMNRLRELR